MAGIVDQQAHPDEAAGGVDARVDEINLAGERLALIQGVEVGGEFLAEGEAGQVLAADEELHVNLADIDDAEKRLRGGDGFAGLAELFHDGAGERGVDRVEPDVFGGDVVLQLGQLQLDAGLQFLVLGDNLVVEEALGAAVVEDALLEHGLGAGEVEFLQTGVEVGERLAGRNRVAFAHGDGGDGALHGGADDDLLEGKGDAVEVGEGREGQGDASEEQAGKPPEGGRGGHGAGQRTIAISIFSASVPSRSSRVVIALFRSTMVASSRLRAWLSSFWRERTL